MLCYGFLGKLSFGTQRVVPSGQDKAIFPARVANHRTGFGFIPPAHGASHTIIGLIQLETKLLEVQF